MNILLIEDSDADHLLIERSLKQHGLACTIHRVSSLAATAEAVMQGPWDVVLSDYTVPGMDFEEGLTLVLSRLPDVPFIVVSGTVGEERAVAVLKLGVSDFVLKDRLLRLGPAIERAVKEMAERKALRAAESGLRLLSAAMKAASQPVVITNTSGTITWVNPAFTTVTGYTFEEAVGKSPGALVKSGLHDAQFYAEFWATIRAGHTWRGVITNRRKNGEIYPEEQVVSAVRDDTGAITHFVGIKRDLTEERQLQAQLQQAQKMESIGLLAGGIAHDFNNLITAINATAELAALDLPEGDPLRTDLEQIRDTGERAANLTRQLLAFSRSQAPDPSVLDLNLVLAGMQGMLARLLGEDVALVVKPAPEPAWVLADRGQIEQVVLNLAVNARDAMPDGGSLVLATELVDLDEEAAAACTPPVAAGSHVRLLVRDSGVGMSEVTRQRIFEPFFTTKGKGKGTGLGLSMVHGIVDQCGGGIRVQSSIGSGTVFSVDLPSAAEAAAAVDEEIALSPLVGGSETILLVEDEDFLRDLARRMLELAGYTVITAENGEAALALLDSYLQPVHLVLSDVVMPGISGGELAARIATRAVRPRVLFTSGYTDDVIVRKGLLDQTTNFLRKPYNMDDLTRKVREVLDA